MEPIKFVRSLLDMNTPLPRARLLYVRAAKVMKGECVAPQLGVDADAGLAFISKVIGQIRTKLKTRNIPMKRGVKLSSKYEPKIS